MTFRWPRFPRVRAAWRNASGARRFWWGMPLIWWALTNGLLGVLGSVGRRLSGVQTGAGDSTLSASFEVLYGTTMYLTAAAAIAGLLLGWLLARLRRERPALWGRRVQVLAAWALVIGSLILLQGAWRCHAPPAPYGTALNAGVQFFLTIQGYLLRTLVVLWNLVGIVVLTGSVGDAVRCIRNAPRR